MPSTEPNPPLVLADSRACPGASHSGRRLPPAFIPRQIPEALRLQCLPNSGSEAPRKQLPCRFESLDAPDAARIEASRQEQCQRTRSLPAANSCPIEYSPTRMMSEQF